jgi:hypothetical protein
LVQEESAVEYWPVTIITTTTIIVIIIISNLNAVYTSTIPLVLHITRTIENKLH